MGTDIHCFGEIKIEGTWHVYTKCNFTRNYDVFSKMGCNKNQYIKPISEPKGLPTDLSLVAQIYHDVSTYDFHSHSWFNSREIKEFAEQCRFKGENQIPDSYLIDSMGYLFGYRWQDFESVQKENRMPDIISNIRWVFWFDN